MASNAGGLKIIAPTFGPVTVTLTTDAGTTPIVFSDPALTTTVALPVSVASTQTLYLSGAGNYTLSVLYGTQQIADPLQGKVQVLGFDSGEFAVRDYSGIIPGPGGGSSSAAGGALVATYNGSVYPLRSTLTASSTTPVEWRGPVPPTVGGGYLLTVDVWTNTGAVV